MMSKHGDLWDSVSSAITRLHDECAEAIMAGTLGEFERHDAMAEIRKCSWFADARPRIRNSVERSVRRELAIMVANYRRDEGLLAADFG